MKANVPEKIYVAKATFPDHIDWDGSPINTNRIEESDIEYTRTDAFTEKAAEWIKNKAEKYIVDTPLCSYFDYKRAVEDFLIYMKGE